MSRLSRLIRDRRAAVSVLFAIAVIPILGLCGLAVDYGLWAQRYSNLKMAANVAALNAVKIAANAELHNDPNAIAEGVTAGTQWFLAEAGNNASILSTLHNVPTVSITTGGVVTAKVTFQGELNSIFGKLFQVAAYPIGGEADASITVAPYLDVEIMLDNSPSMQIGASDGTGGATDDINTLEQLSPCEQTNALYETGMPDVLKTYPSGYWQAADGEYYENYQYNFAGHVYDGNDLPLAVVRTLQPPQQIFVGTAYTNNMNYATAGVPSCSGILNTYQRPDTGVVEAPHAGPPCAFACHYDQTPGVVATKFKDLYGMARRAGVTLRFDLLKQATNQVITLMQADDLSLGNLAVGIFSFDKTVHQHYPATGEAGDDWATAIAAVGAPPANTVDADDTGIKPTFAALAGGPVSNDDTDFPDSMTGLQNILSPAGDGTTAAKAKKVLFIVTDGFDDYVDAGGNEQRVPFDPSSCTPFKDMGYTIYVVYTPYYPVKHEYYLQNMYNAVEGAGPGTLRYSLKQCSTATPDQKNPYADYIEASSQKQLSNALQSFLIAALKTPARYTF